MLETNQMRELYEVGVLDKIRKISNMSGMRNDAL